MNRTIKFRVWNGDRMLYPEYFGSDAYDSQGQITIGWTNQSYIDLGSIAERPYEAWERCILMQFTGLYDSENKEIWEGDILEYKKYYANIKWWSSVEEIPIIAEKTEQQRQDFRIEKQVVKFVNGAFCLGYIPLEQFCCNNIVSSKLEKGQIHNCDYEKKQWDFKVIGNFYEHSNLLNSG